MRIGRGIKLAKGGRVIRYTLITAGVFKNVCGELENGVKFVKRWQSKSIARLVVN